MLEHPGFRYGISCPSVKCAGAAIDEGEGHSVLPLDGIPGVGASPPFGIGPAFQQQSIGKGGSSMTACMMPMSWSRCADVEGTMSIWYKAFANQLLHVCRKGGEGQHQSGELLPWLGVGISTSPPMTMLVKRGPVGSCCQHRWCGQASGHRLDGAQVRR